MTAIGKALRTHRENSNTSLRTVAFLAGVSPSYLSDCERGNRIPSRKALLDIAHATGMDRATAESFAIKDVIERWKGK